MTEETQDTTVFSGPGESGPGARPGGREHLWLFPKSALDQLSADFHLREFRCRCNASRCHMTLVHPRLVECLQALREQLARPLILTSGYRCNSYNKIIGGRPRSYHTRGMAADVLCQDLVQLEELAQVAAEHPSVGGLGRYPLRRFVHLDVRPRKDAALPVTWSE